MKFVFSFLLLLCMNDLSSQDLKLWYNKPATKWTEALPIGNGRIGAMIFGGVVQDRIQFNEETLWTGGPREYNRRGASNYLDTIRQLLFAGKQKEAEALAEAKFMGLKSNEGKKAEWVAQILLPKNNWNRASAEDFDDAQWKTMEVPSYEGWEAVGFEGLDGAVWLRTKFKLPLQWEGKDIVLDLNRIRDDDFTYINGKLLGKTEGPQPRKYIIPKEWLHQGVNVLAILVLNYFDKGGVSGYKDTSRHIGIYPDGEPETKKLSLNGNWKFAIQNDEPPEVGTYQASYQPFGDLWLNFNHTASISNYKRDLDISNAVATTSYSTNGVDYKREYIVSQPNQLIAVHLSANRKGSINFEAKLSSPHKFSSVKKINNNTISLTLKVRNGVLRGESRLQVIARGGTITVQNDMISVMNADEKIIKMFLPILLHPASAH